MKKFLMILLLLSCTESMRTDYDWEKGKVVNRVYEKGRFTIDYDSVSQNYIVVERGAKHYVVVQIDEQRRIALWVDKETYLSCIYGKTYIREEDRCE